MRKKLQRQLTTNHAFVQLVTVCPPRTVDISAVGDHLPHHKPPFRAVVDHVLPESRKEQVKETLEPTQHELLSRTSQEAGFSKTIGLGQSSRARPRCNAEGKWIVPSCKELTKPRSIERATIIKVFSKRDKNWSRSGRHRRKWQVPFQHKKFRYSSFGFPFCHQQ